jgi:RNA polymerase sigma factor (sigma-70 family)
MFVPAERYAGMAMNSQIGGAVCQRWVEPMAEEPDQWQRLVQGLRNGEPQQVREFCTQYGDLLYKVAEQHLPSRLRRRLGPEDVVQSVCRTFLRRAKDGEFQLVDSGSLWRLLCAITLTKVHEQARFHSRWKRGFNQEVPLALTTGAGSDDGPAIPAPGPSPAEAAEFADQFEQVIAGLAEEERRIVDLKLQEYTNKQVARDLGCSERTVRRLLKRVQARLARVFLEP